MHTIRDRATRKRCATQAGLRPSTTAPPAGGPLRHCRSTADGGPFAATQIGGIPHDCPFSIRPMNDKGSLFLIREKDEYGEYPNIYAKIVSSASHESNQVNVNGASLIVLCDTGCGTNVELVDLDSTVDALKVWSLGTFLEATLNPQNALPYLVIISHCHFDHILGIKHLDLRHCTILSSAYDRCFITPRSHLAEHSICNDLGISPPKYDVGMWAKNFQQVTFTPLGSSQPISTGITILHTPGHTPDSLTWYDSTLSPPHVFVGDSLYERQSLDTKDAKWGREPPMPTIFNVSSNLADWQSSMDKVLKFVQERNCELKATDCEAEIDDWVLVPQASEDRIFTSRVKLGAAHVTVSVDAERCLLAMKDFMEMILECKIPHCRVEDEKGHQVWLWDDLLDIDGTSTSQKRQHQPNFGRFSVRAPLFVIDRERARIEQNLHSHDNNR